MRKWMLLLGCAASGDAQPVITSFMGQGLVSAAQVTTTETISPSGIPSSQPSVNVALGSPRALVATSDGTVFVADGGIILRSRNAFVTRFAGGGATAPTAGSPVPRLNADLGIITAMAHDGSGGVYVASSRGGTDFRIYRVQDSNATLIAGNPNGTSNGTPLATDYRIPGTIQGLAASGSDVFFTEVLFQRIRRITADQRVNGFAGTGLAGFNGDGQSAILTNLTEPAGIAVQGNSLLVAELVGCRLRVIPLNGGNVSTAAGNGTCGRGPGQLDRPTSVAVGFTTTVAVAESGGGLLSGPANALVRVNPNGSGGQAPDGAPAATGNVFANSVALDSQLRLMATDGSRVRIVVSAPVEVQVFTGGLTGASVTVDGQAALDGKFTAIEGTKHTLSVSKTVTVSANERQTFNSYETLRFLAPCCSEPAVIVTVPFSIRTINAFYRRQFAINTSFSPAGGGVIEQLPAAGGAALTDPKVFYNSGSSVIVTAKPNEGFALTGLNAAGANASGGTSTLVVDAPKAVSAKFDALGGFSPIRFNVGGAQFTDELGQTWAADPFTVGSISTTEIIGSTAAQGLYQTARRATTITTPAGATIPVPIQYELTVPQGTYNLRLKFADFQSTAAGQRKFDILVNGNAVQRNLDIVLEAGGRAKAIDKLFRVRPEADGKITVRLARGDGGVGDAMLNAIQLVRDVVGVTVSPGARTLFASDRVEFVSTVAGSDNVDVTWSIEPGLGEISESGVYTAPSSILDRAEVVVTATSKADPTRNAKAYLQLSPPWTDGQIDGVPFRYQTLKGDGDLLVRFDGPGDPGQVNAVVIRESLAADSAYGMAALRGITADSRFRLQGAAEQTRPAGSGVTWLHMRRVGDQLSTWFSLDGVTFDVAESATVPMKEEVLIGLYGPGPFGEVGLGSPVGIQLNHRSGSLTAGQSVQMAARVVGTPDSGVTWSIAPEIGTITSSGLYRAPDAVTPFDTRTVSIIASANADPSKRAVATFTLGGFQEVRVNAGGTSAGDDETGVFSTDVGFAGGRPRTFAGEVRGANPAAVYQSDRFSRDPFEYRFALPAGSYSVKLRFAEKEATAARQRVFHVEINGRRVIEAMDVFALAGGANRPFDLEFDAEAVDGEIRVRFVPVTGDAMISGIEINR